MNDSVYDFFLIYSAQKVVFDELSLKGNLEKVGVYLESKKYPVPHYSFKRGGKILVSLFLKKDLNKKDSIKIFPQYFGGINELKYIVPVVFHDKKFSRSDCRVDIEKPFKEVSQSLMIKDKRLITPYSGDSRSGEFESFYAGSLRNGLEKILVYDKALQLSQKKGYGVPENFMGESVDRGTLTRVEIRRLGKKIENRTINDLWKDKYCESPFCVLDFVKVREGSEGKPPVKRLLKKMEDLPLPIAFRKLSKDDKSKIKSSLIGNSRLPVLEDVFKEKVKNFFK